LIVWEAFVTHRSLMSVAFQPVSLEWSSRVPHSFHTFEESVCVFKPAL
jgi:hypothetical protein